MKSWRPFIGLAVVVLPTIASSQGIPLLAAELTVGGGAHTLHTAHTYYRETAVGIARAAATLRLGTSGVVRPVVTLEYSPGCGLGVFGCGGDAVCFIAPDRTCEQEVDDLLGRGIAGGVEIAWGVGRALHVLSQLSYGTANYASSVRYIDANTSLQVVSHLSIVADVRRITWHDGRGDPMWFRPVSFGIRVY